MHACPIRGAPYTRAFMAVRDYYEVLGVTRTANAEEIRRAHRKLALQYHPDRNKEKSAPTRFAEIQQAYEVLSDDEKRKQYDDFIRIGGTPEAFAGGAGAAGAGAGAGGGPFGAGGPFGGGRGQTRPTEQWTSSDSETFESIFGDIFNRGGAGGARRGRGPQQQRGRAQAHTTYELAVPLERVLKGGRHRFSIDGENHEIEIPVGIEDDEVLAVPGRLDVVVRVRADAHAWLTRDDRDLSYDLPLTIVEATLGAAIDAPLPTGGSISLKIPPGTASGKKMRIPGKGVPAAGGRPAGDLFVVVQIVPPKEPSELTRSLLKEIGGTLENPRARIAHLRS